MNAVVLGNVCIDKNNIEGKFYESAGGPPIFINAFLNKKNVSVTTISSYGQDFLPYKNNLNLYPKSSNVPTSLFYENVVKKGIRAQKCYFYNQIPSKIDAKMKKIIKKSDLLFIAPLTPFFLPNYISDVAGLTRKDCLKILLPQGYFRDFDNNNNVVLREFKEAEKILPLVDIVILSNEDYPNTEKLSLSWNKKYGTTFIITKAEKGAKIINKNEKVIVSTNPIPLEDIVDSVGAGDIFSASFGYHYFRNKHLVKSVKLANKAAGEKLLSLKPFFSF